MKAILPKTPVENGRNYSSNKEEVNCLRVVAYSKGEFHIPVTARFWMGRSSQASVVYCGLWFHGRGKWYAGHGSAGGYGYHKESAALQEALSSAGVELRGSAYRGEPAPEDLKRVCHIDGVGDVAMKAALEALARALGFRKFTVV